MSQTLPTPASTAVPAPTTRLMGFDLMRIAAAVGVVWIHALQSSEIEHLTRLARFAVPFFAFAAVFFAADSASRNISRSLASYARDRFVRLYLPLLGWSVIYLLFINAKYLAGQRDGPLYPTLPMLWRGSTIHLWFMPFLIVTSLAAFALARILARRSQTAKRAAAITLAAAGALICIANPGPYILHDQVLGGAWYTLPSSFWAMAFWLCYTPRLLPILTHSAVTVASLMLLVGSVVGVWALGWNSALVNLAGLGAFLMGFMPIRESAVKAVRSLGSLTYGVYLCHGLLLGIWGTLFRSMLHRADYASTDLIVFALGTISSFVAVYVLRKWRPIAWLFP